MVAVERIGARYVFKSCRFEKIKNKGVNTREAADKTSSFGGTDNTYVATAFYYYSALLAAKAAYVLGVRQDSRDYCQLAAEP